MTTPGNSSKATPKKKEIPLTPSNPLTFFLMCIIYLIKKIVFASAHVKIGAYMFALIICSLLKDFNLINQRYYLSRKQSLLNVYFVKFGWAWTLVTTVPFVLMTSIVITNGNQNLVRKNLTRLIIATFFWYTLTSLFEIIDTRTGRCSLKSVQTKLDCKVNRNEWLESFDISGHTFLLMYSLLVMVEESKVFEHWEALKKNLESKAQEAAENNETDKKIKWFIILTPFIKFFLISMAILAVLWEFMLLVTFLYYHEMMHKLIAACFAIAAWFITYQTWFSYRNLFLSPGLPGDDLKLSENSSKNK